MAVIYGCDTAQLGQREKVVLLQVATSKCWWVLRLEALIAYTA